MKPYEKLFLANLLETASEEFSSHKCNDVDYEDYKHMKPDEQKELTDKISKWHMHDIGDPFSSIIHIPDWLCLSFFVDKLRKEAEDEEGIRR